MCICATSSERLANATTRHLLEEGKKSGVLRQEEMAEKKGTCEDADHIEKEQRR